MHICFVWSVRGYFIRIQSIACKQSCKQSNNWVRVVCVLTLRLFVAFNFFWIMPLLRHPFIGYFLWTVCFLSPLSIPCTICPRQPHSCCTPKQESPVVSSHQSIFGVPLHCTMALFLPSSGATSLLEAIRHSLSSCITSISIVSILFLFFSCINSFVSLHYDILVLSIQCKSFIFLLFSISFQQFATRWETVFVYTDKL